MKIATVPAKEILPSPDLSGFYHSIPLRIFYLKFLRPLPYGLKVLDVGCGSGYVLQVLQKMRCEVFGLDQSLELIKLLETSTLPVQHYEVGHSSGFDGSQYDLILCLDVLEHVNPLNRPRFLQELFSWKRNTNSLLISLPFYKGHGHAPDMDELRPFLDSNNASLFLVRFPPWFVLLQKLKHFLRKILKIQEADSFEGNYGFQNLTHTKKGALISILLLWIMNLFHYFPMGLEEVEAIKQEGTYLIFIQ